MKKLHKHHWEWNGKNMKKVLKSKQFFTKCSCGLVLSKNCMVMLKVAK